MPCSPHKKTKRDMLTITASFGITTPTTQIFLRRRFMRIVAVESFPPFLPKQVENIKDADARKLASGIQRLPVNVSFAEKSIMSSCVAPSIGSKAASSPPLLLLHGFDSSCLEWRYTYPLLEEAGLEAWAVDVLGWGFSDLEILQPCDVASKREHLYQLWKSYIKRPVVLVGPSLGAAVAVDFAANHPDAVKALVLIDASVYAEGTGNMAKLPRMVAYAGVNILKSVPLRLYANFLTFKDISLGTAIDWMKIGRLHCLYPWWKDATISFMIGGGYNVSPLIEKVKQRTLIIWGEDDQIISSTLALKLQSEMSNSTLRQIPKCGHLPHVEKPDSTAQLIVEFVGEASYREVEYASPQQ